MILDTNALSDLLAGNPALAKILGDTERSHLPSIVLGEYRFGLEASHQRAALEELLNQVEAESILLAVDAETARHYATIRNQLQKQGTPIPTNDLWIAALAHQHNQPIISQDRHFDHVAGVRRISW